MPAEKENRMWLPRMKVDSGLSVANGPEVVLRAVVAVVNNGNGGGGCV